MTSIICESVWVRSGICFWTFLLCVACLYIIVFTWRQKKYGLLVEAGMIFLLTFGILQIMIAIAEWYEKGLDSRLLPMFGKLPTLLLLLTLLTVSVIAGGLGANVLRWHREHITPMSINESMDELSSGLCYYRNNGFCVLSNHMMDTYCQMLTGHHLQDGLELYNEIKDKSVIQLSNGKVLLFRHRVLLYKGEPLQELIADDITELHRKTEKLKVDSEHARQLNENMKSYNREIDDMVRLQEILQAKINIHDGMNQMILATKKAIRESTEQEREEILRGWQNDALLLCVEARSSINENMLFDIGGLAKLIGIQLIMDEMPLIERAECRELFLLTAREAMMNAVKHAKAKVLYIHAREENSQIIASFSNDGKTPSAVGTETGGLKTLRRKLTEAGGTMEIQWIPKYVLTICFQK